jgi:hypothetical protein
VKVGASVERLHVTVPDSAIAQWIRGAEKVVLIDGCFLSCHGRILEDLLSTDQLIQFDALKVYKKYTDVFDIDEVPEAERKKGRGRWQTLCWPNLVIIHPEEH